MRQRYSPLLIAVSVVIGLARCCGPWMDHDHELAVQAAIGVWVSALLVCYFVQGRPVCLLNAAGLTVLEAIMGLLTLLR